MITDRLIRPASLIPRRDVRIHEAGHFVAGVALNFPMRWPRVFADGSGLAPINRDALPNQPKTMREVIAEIPEPARRDAVVCVASLYLAGYCAELVSCDEYPDRRHVYGRGTSDVCATLKLLADAGSDSDRALLAAWNLSMNVLAKHWDSVIDVAAAIQVSEPTESDRRALAA